MDLLLEESCICMLGDEVLHLLKLILAASLKTRRVMEDESLIAFEDHLMVDIMESTL